MSAREAFMAVPQVTVGTPHTVDRTADLGSAIVYLSLDVSMHLFDPAQARALAAAFTKAAEMLDAAAAGES